MTRADGTRARSRLELMFERFVVLSLRFPEALPAFADSIPNELSTSPHFHLYKAIKEGYTNSTPIQLADLRHAVTSTGGEQSLDILLMKGDLEFSDFTEKEATAEVEMLMRQIREEWKKQRRKELQRAIENAEREKDEARLRVLLQEFQNI